MRWLDSASDSCGQSWSLGHPPFLGLESRRRVSGDEEERSHWVHVAQRWKTGPNAHRSKHKKYRSTEAGMKFQLCVQKRVLAVVSCGNLEKGCLTYEELLPPSQWL